MNSDSIHTHSLRQQAFKLLEKNHELKPKDLCKLLDLDYQTHAQTISQYKTQYKSEYRNRLAPKCLSFHRVRGFVFALRGFDRVRAVERGWVLSKARNRMLVWVDPNRLGRIEWFETGRINFWVRKPSTWARVKQLLADGFMWTELIVDVRVFEEWVKTARLKGAHTTLDLGEPLPYSRTELLKDSNGVIVKTGDLSHPTSLEIEFVYPDFCERSELALTQLGQFFRDFLGLSNGKAGSTRQLGREDYST